VQNRALGIACALLAALTFGSVNVAARVAITNGLQPLWVAAFAYVIGGIALSPVLRHGRVQRADRPRLAIVVLSGAVAAPILLFYGLSRTSAVDSSLLLNLEMVFTGILAFRFLGERARGHELLGLAAITVGAVLVSLAAGREGASSLLGAALVALAALGWGIDNTASTPLAARYDPRVLIAWKTLVGGTLVVLVALLLAGPPGGTPRDWALAGLIGLVGVAASSVIFYVALRHLGAARTTVIFSTSALVGAALGHFLLAEPLTALHLAGAGASVLGVLLVTLRRPG